jgi:predicted DNA-binding transcriptional regulator AlpA
MKPNSAAVNDGSLETTPLPETAPVGDAALWRLPTVLTHVPVSRSGWWAGIKAGRYPAPVRLSPRCVAWRSEDIRSLIASL